MVNDNSDTEKSLYKELASIQKFKDDVSLLKDQIEELTERVEQLENLDFQNQLNCLDRKVTNLTNDLIETKQKQYQLLFTILRELAAKILHYNTEHYPVLKPDLQRNHDLCFLELQNYYMKYTERVKNCQNKQAMEDVFNNFVNDINTILAKYHFPQIDISK